MGDLFGDFLARSNATIEIETTVSPKIVVNLSEAYAGEPGALVGFLRPRIVIRAGELVHTVEPAGPLEASPPWGKLFTLAGLATAVVAWRSLR